MLLQKLTAHAKFIAAEMLGQAQRAWSRGSPAVAFVDAITLEDRVLLSATPIAVTMVEAVVAESPTITQGVAAADARSDVAQGQQSVEIGASAASIVVVDTTADYGPLDARYGNTLSIATLQADKGSDNLISLREALAATNITPNAGVPDEIHFNIPNGDPRHFYYQQDGIPGSLSVVAATALDDASIVDFDADYPFAQHSWFSIDVSSALPQLDITDAVFIDGYTQPGATANTLAVGHDAALNVELTNDGGGGRGLTVQATGNGSQIRGLAINNFGASGILTEFGADGVIVQGNFLGTDITGTLPAGNGDGGVHLRSNDNQVGGPNPADRNLISGNANRGIITFAGSLKTGNVVENNYIGVNATGLSQISNGTAGIQVWNQDGMRILDNVISGNDGPGIWLRDGSTKNNTTMQGNLIGVGADGITATGNNGDGILVHNLAQNTLIGGTAVGQGNVIAANVGHGIYSLGNTVDGTIIQGNSIGVDAVGGAKGNGRDGIRVDDNSDNNSIGGTVPGAGNIIGNNNGDGIVIASPASRGTAILRNSIFDNTGLGIDLEDDNVTSNDDGDGDAGTNDLQNFPVITGATTDGANVTISGWLNSATASTFRLEFFVSDFADPAGHGEGETFINFASVATDAAGFGLFSETFTHAVAAGQVITATATNAVNNTSELSLAVEARVKDITFDGLWVSTEGDVVSPSGAPGLDSWTDGEALSFGGPSLDLEPTTTVGQFASALNLNLLGDGNVDIDAMHYVTQTVPVGGGAATIILDPGDLLLSTAANESFFGGTFAVDQHDVFVLRPVAAGEYSVGKLELLLDMDSPSLSLPVPDPNLGFAQLTAISLIEQDTTFGGVALDAGDFLFTRDGGPHEDIFMFYVTAAGQGVTDGTAAELIQGSALGFGNAITGLELIESPIDVGGTTLSGGEIVLTLAGDPLVLDADVDPANDFSVMRQDLFRVTVSQTELNGGTLVAAGQLLFEGAEVGLSSNAADLDAVTIAGGTPVNTPSVVTNLAGDSLAYAEDDPATVIEQGADVTVTDGDSTDFDNGTLTVAVFAGGAPAEDLLSIRDQGMGLGQIGFDGTTAYFSGTPIGTVVGGSGGVDLVVTFNPNANATAAASLIQNIAYRNLDTVNPTTTARTIRYALNDGDGGSPAVLDATVNVSLTNDPPIVAAPVTATVAEETQTAMPGISISDADAGGAALTTRLQVNDGTLDVLLVGGAAISMGANGTNDLTIQGNATDISASLASLRYTGNPDVTGVAADTLTITVDDLGNTGAPGARQDVDTVSINITAVNDPPVNSVPATLSVNEGTPTALLGVSVSDTDAAAGLLTTRLQVNNGVLDVTLSGAATLLAGVNGSSDLTVQGDLTDLNATLSSLRYTGNAGVTGVSADTITITTNDLGNTGIPGPWQDLDTIQVDIIAVNDAPVNIVPGVQTVGEATPTAIPGVSVSDTDAAAGLLTTRLQVNNGVLDVTLSGAATLLAGVNGSSDLTVQGDLTDLNATLSSLRYTGNAGVTGVSADTITITTNDLGNTGIPGPRQDADTIQLDVTPDNNDPPVNIVPGTQVANEAVPTSILGLGVSDPDAATGLLTTRLQVSSGVLDLTLAGGATISAGANGSNDLTLLGNQTDLTATLASLQYTGNAGVTGTAADAIMVTTDDQGNTGPPGPLQDVDTIQIDISDINDPPVLMVPGPQVLSEDVAFPILGVGVSDVDAGTASIQISLSVTWGTVTVNPGVAGGVPPASIAGNVSGNVVLTATLAQVNATLANASGVIYVGNPNFNGSDTLVIVADDLGNTGSGAPGTDSRHVLLNVVPVNDAPVATDDTFTASANGSLVIPTPGLLINDGDVDSGTISAYLVAGPLHGSLTLLADGSFTYTPQPGFAGTDSFTYVASDGGLTSQPATVNIVMTAPPPPTPSPSSPDPTEDESDDAPLDGPSAINPRPRPPADSPVNHRRKPITPAMTEPPLIALLPTDSVPIPTAARGQLMGDLQVDPGRGERVSESTGRPLRLQDMRFAMADGLLWHDLDELSEKFDADIRIPDIVIGGTAGATSVLTVGYAVWLLKGGHILAGVLAQMPAWKLIDPLPILAQLDEEAEDLDDDSLQVLIDQDHDHSRYAAEAQPAHDYDEVSTG